MSVLRTIGPAIIEVWISSPVRSRKPVLMNATRDLAARMHSARFTVVRRSSSMMPILTVLRGRPSTVSTRLKISFGEGDLGRAVHLRLDDVDRTGRALDVGAQARHRAQHGDHRVEQSFVAPASDRGRARPAWSSDDRRCEPASAPGRAGSASTRRVR